MYLPLCQVAYTPFHIQGDDMVICGIPFHCVLATFDVITGFNFAYITCLIFCINMSSNICKENEMTILSEVLKDLKRILV